MYVTFRKRILKTIKQRNNYIIKIMIAEIVLFSKLLFNNYFEILFPQQFYHQQFNCFILRGFVRLFFLDFVLL